MTNKTTENKAYRKLQTLQIIFLTAVCILTLTLTGCQKILSLFPEESIDETTATDVTTYQVSTTIASTTQAPNEVTAATETTVATDSETTAHETTTTAASETTAETVQGTTAHETTTTAASETTAETADGSTAAETTAHGTTAGGTTSPTEESPDAVDFAMTLLDGSTVRLSDYSGRKVMLNFWATWCGPCVREMPELERLYSDYADSLVILAVDCGESASDLTKFIDKNGYTFPIVLDEDYRIQALFEGIEFIPTSIFFDENGVITGSTVGSNTYEGYKEMLGLN